MVSSVSCYKKNGKSSALKRDANIYLIEKLVGNERSSSFQPGVFIMRWSVLDTTIKPIYAHSLEEFN